MSIHVTDFKWEKGKNDLEYIALLEKTLDITLDNFERCSKVAREQYNRGKADGIRKFAEWLEKKGLLIDMKFSGDSDWDRLSSKDVIAEYEKEQMNE